MEMAQILPNGDKANLMTQEQTKSAETQQVSGVDAFLGFAQGLADISGPLCRDYFRHPLIVDLKADSSPVTVADRAVESLLRETIQVAYPDHGIFGEEHGTEDSDSPFTWVLDPIDGTKSFITGMPTFGTLIALLENGKPIVGIVDIPALGERWVGAKKHATLLDGALCRTRACTRLEQAHLYATSPDIFSPADGAVFERVSALAAMRRFGGDCYAYGLLASGHVDVVMETSLEPYDFMALVPVIEGAGGVITDWDGMALTLASDGRVLAAATADLHRNILNVMQAD